MIKPFWIVIKDEDAKTFNVLGPSTDDTAITHAVYEAQQDGRNVRCFTVPVENDPDRQALMDSCAKDFGLTHTDEPIV